MEIASIAVSAGGALLSPALQVLLDKLAERKASLKKMSLKDLLKKLRLKLLPLNKVIHYAEWKQMSDENVEAWLVELMQVVYDAEDVLNDIEAEILEHQMEATGSHTQTDTVYQLTSKDVQIRLSEIVHQLGDLVSQRYLLGLEEVVGPGSPFHRLPTSSQVLGPKVYGRQNEKEAVINLMCSDDNACRINKIRVVALIGIGGVGKTTIAQLVYNDNPFNFDVKVWVCVSEVFDIIRVTKTILEALGDSEASSKEGFDLLQRKLRDQLKGKKFLIVFDDVWTEDYAAWNLLCGPLFEGLQGSVIIVTTRNEVVASVVKCANPYHVNILNEEDSLLLFIDHAFTEGDSFIDPELKVIGRKIVKKCKGLPLAIKSLGGLLYSKKSVDEWNDVLRNDIWDLPKQRCGILPSLMLSYYYLPSHLKRCFAYCSLFPKDYEFNKEELVLLWIAEGFLEQTNSKKRMEDVGNEYFMELLRRSFFQQTMCDKIIPSLVMHDLMNDLAQYVGRGFFLHIEGEDSSGKVLGTRHLSISIDFPVENYASFHEIKSLRTFLLLSSEPLGVRLDVLSENLCQLRVLSLAIYNDKFEEIPDSIGNLKHLRYLNLSWFRKLKKLPKSLCTLYNLQTLKLDGCRSLMKLPEDMNRLVNLRHLDTYGTQLEKMQLDVSNAKNLQTFTDFIVDRSSSRCGIKELKRFPYLEKLHIKKLGNVEDAAEAGKADLKRKKHLRKLVLEWEEETNNTQLEREVLDNLMPHTNLEFLEIKCYGGFRFPEWLGDSLYSNMITLCLEECRYCEDLPPLGQLRSLKYLRISALHGVERVGEEFYGKLTQQGGSFRSLELLWFEDMPMWRNWSCPSTAFPSLERLWILGCHTLTGDLPSRLPHLTQVCIQHCEKLELPMWYFEYPCLVTLIISYNSCIESFPLCKFPMIRNISLYNLGKLRTFSSSVGETLVSLCDLSITDCPNLVLLPERMGSLFPSLRKLCISNCPMVTFTYGGLPSNLRELYLWHCEELYFRPMEWGLNAGPSSLRELESFPEEGLLPSSLEQLHIRKMDKMKSLNGKGLQPLTSLRILEIQSCRNLQCISGKQRLPTSLTELCISNCHLLRESCQKDKERLAQDISHPKYQV